MTKTKQMTVPQATKSVRRHVDALMPGVLATVESRLSHDLATDTATVVTTVTFPAGHANAGSLKMALTVLPNVRKITVASASIIVTRTR